MAFIWMMLVPSQVEARARAEAHKEVTTALGHVGATVDKTAVRGDYTMHLANVKNHFWWLTPQQAEDEARARTAMAYPNVDLAAMLGTSNAQLLTVQPSQPLAITAGAAAASNGGIPSLPANAAQHGGGGGSNDDIMDFLALDHVGAVITESWSAKVKANGDKFKSSGPEYETMEQAMATLLEKQRELQSRWRCKVGAARVWTAACVGRGPGSGAPVLFRPARWRCCS